MYLWHFVSRVVITDSIPSGRHGEPVLWFQRRRAPSRDGYRWKRSDLNHGDHHHHSALPVPYHTTVMPPNYDNHTWSVCLPSMSTLMPSRAHVQAFVAASVRQTPSARVLALLPAKSVTLFPKRPPDCS